MKNVKAIKNRIFLYTLIAVICVGISFTVQSSYAQYGYNGLSLHKASSVTGYTMPFSSISPSYTSYYPITGIGWPMPLPIINPKPKPKPEPIDVRPVTISLNASDNGELTGDMLIMFDSEASVYPKNYDYFYDGNEIYKDIKAYVHTPLSTCLCPTITAASLTDEVNEIIKCCCRCSNKAGQLIFSFKVSKPGIYKINELVWARNCGHDSFFVELKRDDKRIPFPAFTTDPAGNLVLVKKAHDRFEFTGQYEEWHWKPVSHWNAYVSPKEIARTCYFYLRSGTYSLIYSTRESLTRIAAVNIVRVWPKSITCCIEDSETFELDTVKEYFEANEVEDASLEPKVEDLTDLNIAADEIFLEEFN